MSEFLREEQGNSQVTQKQDGKDERDPGNEIHDLPQLLARLDVEKRQAEENCREKQHRDILHCMSLSSKARQQWAQTLNNPSQCPRTILDGGSLWCRKGFLRKI
jgi:hypothetical protein